MVAATVGSNIVLGHHFYVETSRRNIREDFATVPLGASGASDFWLAAEASCDGRNCLDLPSRSKLAGLPGRVALRTMGLLGTGNSFFMEGPD